MKKSTIINLVFAFCIIITSCTGMEDYLNIVGRDEITYPGKITNAVVFGGHNRVLIMGQCVSDAKVVDCEITWNLGKESKVVPVDMSNGVFELSVELELSEGIYNFDLYTRDALGNRSVPVNISAEVFGESFQMQIRNRQINEIYMSGTTAVVTWYPVDTTLGAKYTVVVWTTLDGESTYDFLLATESTCVLENIDTTQPFVFFTRYMPNGCMDMFETEQEEFYVQ